jgi:hypothetical protein
MKILLISLIVIAANTSFAEVIETSKKTYFDALGEHVNRGIKPEINELADKMLIGRCFTADKPNEPIAGAFLLRGVESPEGPIANIKTYEASALINPQHDFYDALSFSEVENQIKFYPIKANEIAISFSRTGLVTNSLFKSDELMLLETSVAGRTPDISARCYYYMKH